MNSLTKSTIRTLLAASALAIAGVSVAQMDDTAPAPNATGLDLPANIELLGKPNPNVRKPTAIVNKAVITGTDVDQRAAMVMALNNIKVDGEERQRLQLQVLRQLIDETLQIQEARRKDIVIKKEDLDLQLERIARGMNRTRATMAAYLRQNGSSEASLRRQLEGELAWRRVLSQRVEPFVNVSDEEVNAILERLKATQGAEEYHLREIFLSATPDQQTQVAAQAQRIIDQIRANPQPAQYFAYAASQNSKATTRAVGGDLGWVRGAQLPEALAANAAQMQIGQIAGPIDVGGGYSILWMVDKRRILTADPRDARLDLRQITLDFAPGTTRAQATGRASAFAEAIKGLRGCGDVDAVASKLGAKVVTNDQNRIRDLPPQLQEILLQMQVGQSTPPFGSPDTGVRALVLCGRDDPQGGQLPDARQLKNGLESDRVNRVAQRMLRDLRRDALIEYK